MCNWLVKHGLVGKEPEEIAKALDATDETTGMKVWQNYALNDTTEKTVGSRTVKVKTSKWTEGGEIGVGQGFWLVKPE